MPLIIYPSERLTGLGAGQDTNRQYVVDLTSHRATQMDGLWRRVAAALDLDVAEALATRRARILPAAGAIIIERGKESDDTLWERLRRESWLQVYRLNPLPPVTPMAAPVQQIPSGAWHLARINPPSGFDGSGTIVGVVDTGIDPVTFPELAGIRMSQSVYSLTTKTLSPAGTTVELDVANQHGSAVCSMLAGATSGLAPGAELVLATVPDQAIGLHAGTIADAVDWLLKQTTSNPRLGQAVAGGCDIINISRVISAPGIYDGSLYKLLLEAGTDYGTLVVAGSGNSGSVNKGQCPGAYDCVLSVGAVTSQDAVFGSAWGTVLVPATGPGFAVARPDLVAPGQGLNQPTATASMTRGGTSFATALVTGAAALALQKDASLIGNPTAIKNRLTSLARGGPKPKWGAGVLDLTNL